MRKAAWTTRLFLRGLSVSALALVLAHGAGAQAVTRGPYLQQMTFDGVIVRWRTDFATDDFVRYGTAPDTLDQSATSGEVTTEHVVPLAGLAPATRYYYTIGSTAAAFAGGGPHSFVTAPPPGTDRPVRIWVIGDSGTANANARAVRDAFKAFTGARQPALWLMLGDNAYPDGTQDQYQSAVFDTYPALLRKIALWPTLGNHDGHTPGAYLDIFTLPTGGEAGGLASGSELYYSFDYANIHFVCLDSYLSDRSPGGAMLLWLENDLMVNDKEWVIAFWHHPPYSKGSHDSDSEAQLIDMRENALPILEAYGVDLVLTGHSHSYERSMLIDSHYGLSTTLDATMIVDGGDGRPDGDGAYAKLLGANAPHEGAVYAVAGSSGQTSGGPLDHPAMVVSLNSLGSLVLDIYGERLEAAFIDNLGARRDWFTLENGPDQTPPAIVSAEAEDDTTVTLLFAEDVDPLTAETAANYTIDQGVTVASALLDPDGRRVRLATSPLASGTLYTVTVTGVEDPVGNAMITADEATLTFVALTTVAFQDGVAPSPAYEGTADTYLSEAAPDSNFGLDPALLVDGDDPGGTGQDLSTLIAWDLSAIPAGAIVESATLTLEVTNPSSQTYEVYQVLHDWVETGVTWQDFAQGPGLATSKPAYRAGAALAAINGIATGPLTVPLNDTGVAVVQDWLDGKAPNYGILIADGDNFDGIDFRSSEAAAAIERPKLTVIFSLALGGDVATPRVPHGLARRGATASPALTRRR